MRNLFMTLLVGAAALTSVFVSAPVQAQATRTWVSGVGDDVNPCSRTAPCKTFAGAISKTATGGEINCLDAAGFGALTINKSLTIDCDYTEGGMLAGGNGLVVNATSSSVVRIRGVDIFGVNPPTNGVRVVLVGTLILDHVRIKNFNAANSFGVSFQPTTASKLFISDSLISDNGSGSTGGGILIKPTGAGSATVSLDNVRVVNNTQGVLVDSTGTSPALNVSVRNSAIEFNTLDGFTAVGGTGPVRVMVDGSSSSFNASTGFGAINNARIRIGRSTATGNNTGVGAASGGVIESFGTSQILGNTAADGVVTPVSQK